MVTLYKLDSWNCVRVWSIEHHTSPHRVEIKHGVVGSNLTTQITPFASKEEAEVEITRRSTYMQERKLYTKQVPKTQAFLPMLCQPYKEHHEKMPDEVMVQPKLNGIRCIGSCKGMYSRRNLPINSLPRIREALVDLPANIHLDGELYIHGVPLQVMMGYVKRDFPHKMHDQVQYHVFDIINLETDNDSRQTMIESLVKTMGSKYIIQVPTERCHKTELPAKLKQAIAQQYEGVVIRNPSGLYEIDKRSYYIQKYKPIMEDEFQIIQVVEGKGTNRGLAIFVCKTDEGSEFECVPSFSHARRAQIFNYKQNYVGKWLHVEFECYSERPTRVPLKPIGKEVRDERRVDL